MRENSWDDAFSGAKSVTDICASVDIVSASIKEYEEVTMYTVNGIPIAKVDTGSRSTPFEYAITVTPVVETVSVTTASVKCDYNEANGRDASQMEVRCCLP
jgi:hypothetical protein